MHPCHLNSYLTLQLTVCLFYTFLDIFVGCHNKRTLITADEDNILWRADVQLAQSLENVPP